MIQVLHFRHINADGSINPRGGVTYALELNDEKEIVKFAFACCHNKDNFVRHTGHVKAVGRLKSPKHCKVLDRVYSVDAMIDEIRVPGVFDVKGNKK